MKNIATIIVVFFIGLTYLKTNRRIIFKGQNDNVLTHYCDIVSIDLCDDKELNITE